MSCETNHICINDTSITQTSSCRNARNYSRVAPNRKYDDLSITWPGEWPVDYMTCLPVDYSCRIWSMSFKHIFRAGQVMVRIARDKALSASRFKCLWRENVYWWKTSIWVCWFRISKLKFLKPNRFWDIAIWKSIFYSKNCPGIWVEFFTCDVKCLAE